MSTLSHRTASLAMALVAILVATLLTPIAPAQAQPVPATNNNPHSDVWALSKMVGTFEITNGTGGREPVEFGTQNAEPPVYQVGEAVHYTFFATNLSSAPIYNVTVDDPMLTAGRVGITPTSQTLSPAGQPGAMARFSSGGYVLTSSDLARANANGGLLVNTATVYGNNGRLAGTVSATIRVVENSSLSMTVTADKSSVRVGDQVKFTFRITNSGSTAVLAPKINSPQLEAAGVNVPLPPLFRSLQPNASMTMTSGEYTVTQADLDKGKLVIDAQAEGGTQAVTGGRIIPVYSPWVDHSINTMGLVMVKTADKTSVREGDTLRWTFNVTNTGTTGALNVRVVDPMLDSLGVQVLIPSGRGGLQSVPAGTTRQWFSQVYTVTAEDAQRGVIHNSARAVEVIQNVNPITSNSDEFIVDVVPSPGLTLTTSTTPSGAVKVGTKVTYRYTLTNSGNVPLTNVRVSAPKLAGVSLPTVASLAPGASTTVNSGQYTVTLADLDAGRVTVASTATGSYWEGTRDITSTTSTVANGVEASPALSIVTEADTAGPVNEGGRVVYTYTVRNTGDIAINNIRVTSAKVSGLTPATFNLARGASTTVTSAAYTVTADDVKEGSLAVTGQANGTSTQGQTVASNSSTATLSVRGTPGLTVSTTRAPTGVVEVGDVITYTVTMTNSGSAPLTGVRAARVSGANAALPTTSYSLGPGISQAVTGTYTVTPADLSSGTVAFTANATGTANDGSGRSVTSNSSAVSNTVRGTPGLTVSTTRSPTGVVEVGDVITYTVTMTNSGTAALTGVRAARVSGASVNLPTTTYSLAPGVSQAVTGTYTVTASDLSATSVSFTANATGTGSGRTVTAPSSGVTNTVRGTPALTVSTTRAPTGAVEVGDVITYTVTMTNSGTAPLSSVRAARVSGASASLPTTIYNLAPGASQAVTATYTVTASDLSATSVSFTANATGTGSGRTVTAPNSTVTNTVRGTPAVTVSTTRTPTGTVEVGDTITYTINVRNSGTVNLTGVGVARHAGVNATLPPGTFSLAQGVSRDFTGTYTVTAADLSNGSLSFTARGSGTGSGRTVSANAAAVTNTVLGSPGLSIVTESDSAGPVEVGDRVVYTYTVRNTGNIAINDVRVTSAKVSGLDPATFNLAPGGTQTVTSAVYTVTSTDLDARNLAVTGRANGTTTDNQAVASSNSTRNLTVRGTPGLSVVTTANTSGPVEVGDRITYTYTVRNTGNITTNGISVTSAKVSGLSPATFSLAPSGTQTVTSAAYTVTPADLTSGTLSVTGRANGTTADSQAVQSSNSTVNLTVRGTPGLSVTAESDVTGPVEVGDVITYTYTVRNTGTINQTGVSAARVSGVTGVTLTPTSFALAQGAEREVTGTYTVKAADLTAGTIAFTARATGTTTDSRSVTSNNATVNHTVRGTPGLTVSTTRSPTGVVEVGDVITYTVTMTNSGTAALTGVRAARVSGASVSLPTTTYSLAAGASQSVTGTYTVTAANFEAGTVSFTANATGTGSGRTVTAPNSGVTNTVRGTPALTATTTRTPTGVVEVGDVITYTVTVRNTGTAPLTGVSVARVSGVAPSVPSTTSSLAPGAEREVTGTYRVTAADLDSGTVAYTARASGTGSGRTVTSASSGVTNVVRGTPGLSILANASSGPVEVGDEITYSFTVTNSGTINQTGVKVEAAKLSGVTLTPSNFTLARGVSQTVTGKYTVTAADLTAGKVDVSARATGSSTDGRATSSANANLSTTVRGTPGLSVTTTASTTGPVEVGDRVTYTYTVRNTGTIDQTGVRVTSAKVTGLSPATFDLAAGASRTVTSAAYTVTAADLGAGTLSVTGRANGTTTDSRPVASSDSTVNLTVRGTPGLTVETKADTTGPVEVGDVITYTVTVTNTGTINQTGVSAARVSGAAGVTLAPTSFALAQGASRDVTGTYTVRAADLTAGSIGFTARATGTTTDGRAVTAANSSVTNAVRGTPGLSVTAESDATGPVEVGDVITYTYTVRNTGTINQTGVSVARVSGVTGVTLTPTSFALAQGAEREVTGAYTVKAADLTAGTIAFTARATGTTTDSRSVTSNNATVNHTVRGTPGLTVTTTASTTGPVEVGDRVTYTYTVRNTGTIDQTGVRVTSAKVTGLSPATFDLAAGASLTVTSAAYTVTAADLGAGTLSVTGRANGTTTDNRPVASSDSTVNLTVRGTPGLSILTSAPAGPVEVGDVIPYTFTVTNSGTTDLTSVRVIETSTSLGISPTPASFSLAQGVSNTVTATYTVRPGDLSNGKVDLAVRASGTSGDGRTATSNDSSSSTSVRGTPGLTISGEASTTGPVEVGDEIDYTFTVRNSGTINLTGVKLEAAKLAGATLTPATFSLARSGTQEVTATYTVTAADLTAGRVDVTARATGTTTDSRSVASPNTTVSNTVRGTPGLSITKSADATGPVEVGDTITYSFEVQNTGTIALRNVRVVDPMVTGLTPAVIPSLAVGATAWVTAAPYTVTLGDLEEGGVENVAHATAATIDDRPVRAGDSTVTTPVVGTPGLSITKTVDESGPVEVGDELVYTFTVRNTGNVALSSVRVVDEMLADADVDITPTSVTTLAPNATATFTSRAYTVALADLAAGEVENEAHARGAYQSQVVTSNVGRANVLVDGTPGIALVKSSNASPPVSYGDEIVYTFRVTNTGNVPLTNVRVQDQKLADAGIAVTPASVATLAPGAHATFTSGAYTVTEQEAISGEVKNSATATGTPPEGGPVTSEADSEDVDVEAIQHELRLLKRSLDGGELAGATFRITLPDGTVVDEVTSSTGTYTFAGLDHLQEYVITETKAPPGHNLLPNPVQVRTSVDGIVLVDGDDELVAVDNNDPWLVLVNNTAPLQLPMTGGQGLGFAWPALALLLMIGAAVLTINSRRKVA